MKKVASDPAVAGNAPADRNVNDDSLYLELLLEVLHLHSRLSKENLTEGFVYRDMMSDILKR